MIDSNTKFNGPMTDRRAAGTGTVEGEWNENRGVAARTERRGRPGYHPLLGRREFLPGAGRPESPTSWAPLQRLVRPVYFGFINSVK